MQSLTATDDPDRIRAYVRSVAMRYVRDESDAEDVTAGCVAARVSLSRSVSR